jgi:hypothetical protein
MNDRQTVQMPACNNQVFVVCEAQTMKTQLNETGQPPTILLLWGLRRKRLFFWFLPAVVFIGSFGSFEVLLMRSLIFFDSFDGY